MKCYEIVPIGATEHARVVRGWQDAQRSAAVTAVAHHWVVELWTVETPSAPRLRRATIFPDGSVARPRRLDRQPQFGGG